MGWFASLGSSLGPQLVVAALAIVIAVAFGVRAVLAARA